MTYTRNVHALDDPSSQGEVGLGGHYWRFQGKSRKDPAPVGLLDATIMLLVS